MSSDSRPSSEERAKLASKDTRSEDYIVTTRPTGAANGGYAYHESDEDGEPLCNAGGPDATFEELTIKEAKRKNKSPCELCEMIVRR